MQKDVRFNVHSAIGYVYMQQKKYNDAKPWLERALEVYPTNKFVQNMLNAIQQGILTSSTKERLEKLEKQKEELASLNAQKWMSLHKEQINERTYKTAISGY